MKRNKRLYILLSFALIFVVICALMSCGIFSKYRTEAVLANQVDYTNTLAESFKLLDVPVTVQEDGSYAVDSSSDAQPTSGFSYKLIPGITLPAAPYVEITGKTEIPAYLYIEVKNTNDDVSLTFDNSWTLLSGVTGKKGGTVYTYHNGEALTGDDPQAKLTFPTFTVDTLSKVPTETEGEIRIYAYMLQKVEEQTATDAYNNAPSV